MFPYPMIQEQSIYQCTIPVPINIYSLLRYCSFNCYQFKNNIYTLVFYISIFRTLKADFAAVQRGKLEGKTQTRVAYKLSHFVAHMISKTWWVGIQWVTIQWVASSGSVVCGKAVCLLATWELAHFPSVFWCWRCGYELFMQHCAVLY